ncbi:MarR family transcriptional regulator [bacterium]|nr:MarR family transcriptional regulator [bacterium]MBU1636769.1 MarR family transcriptional regulator [bacterium]MBU1919788.1 MarR family transcriptional regulator [bacterium]RQV94641.1 MAG: MarR family transcriptional regulator [bacterium]
MGFDELQIDLNNRDHLNLALPKLLVATGEIYEKAGDILVFGAYNLTTFKYIVLHTLMEHASQPSMTELKNMIMRSPSNMTQVVDSLAKDGLVERIPSPTDRRINLIRVTEQGRKLMDEVEDYFVTRMRNYLAEFTDEELRVTVQLLLRMMKGAVRELGLTNACLPEVKS